jgi:hypothetical protein
MYVGCHVKCLLCVLDFNSTIFSVQIFEVSSDIKFNESPSIGSLVVPRRTDKLIVAFRNLRNRLRNSGLLNKVAVKDTSWEVISSPHPSKLRFCYQKCAVGTELPDQNVSGLLANGVERFVHSGLLELEPVSASDSGNPTR